MNVIKEIQKATNQIKLKKLSDASVTLQKVLSKFPKNPIANQMMGDLMLSFHEFEQSISFYEKSAEVDFNETVVISIVKVSMHIKKWQKVLDWLNLLSNKKGLDNNLKIQQAIAYREVHEVEKSLRIFSELYEDKYLNRNFYISYGFTLNRIGKYKEAIKIYTAGLKQFTDDFHLNYNAGITYTNLFDYDAAEKLLISASKLNPKIIDLWLTLASCQTQLRKFENAKESISIARQIDPKNKLITFQEATFRMQIGENNEAARLLENIIETHPNDTEANYHLGLIMLKKGKFNEASKYYRYRVRREVNKFGDFNDFDLPVINNSDSVIISWEQGIGDELLYLRLLKSFITQYKPKDIAYICSDKLENIVKQNFPEIKVIKKSEFEHHDIKKFTKKINIGSLIHYVKKIKENIIETNSLKVENLTKKKYLDKLSQTKLKIGFSWKSENKKIGNEKSFSLDIFNELYKNKNIQFISLQYGEVTDELRSIKDKYNSDFYVDNEIDYFNDIDDLLGIISNCDLVITCSNVTAHLAGSLGIKTYLLLPKYFGKIWYWHSDTLSSSWYPSIQIITQNKDGNWDSCVQELYQHLKSDLG
jgi:tetratricopeptide (TPR) repeat protein